MMRTTWGKWGVREANTQVLIINTCKGNSLEIDERLVSVLRAHSTLGFNILLKPRNQRCCQALYSWRETLLGPANHSHFDKRLVSSRPYELVELLLAAWQLVHR